MQKIPVSKAGKGMVLAKPVTRETGVVLMGEGTELNEALIEKLLDLEIKHIVVKGRPLDSGSEGKTLEQLYAELDERFSTVGTDKMACQIKDIIKKDMARRKEEESL